MTKQVPSWPEMPTARKQGKKSRNKGFVCMADGCGNPSFSKGLCRAHYVRTKNKSALTTAIGVMPLGEQHWNWKGGTHTTIDGRVMVYARGNPMVRNGYPYVLRYRLEKSKELKRPLSSTEIVHHVNEIPSCDSPENLEIKTRSSHMKHHCEVRAQRRWSKNFDKCVACETNQTKHKGRGLCKTCYSQQRKH